MAERRALTGSNDRALALGLAVRELAGEDRQGPARPAPDVKMTDPIVELAAIRWTRSPRRVLKLMAEGYDNATIAELLASAPGPHSSTSAVFSRSWDCRRTTDAGECRRCQPV
ncbi:MULTISPECIES: hypothetical protein [Amycolatopsis]|uniref:hypothetical protein n=1 Tax=Amycolatopsis TaxID=1813 RepID=UPI001F3EF579|nr:hypothetical protein [Amycolatopsis sp. FU40]UKD51148.1 hypothetical protein L3Q65_24785 [Amycolatopsis sp. FU40]